MQITTNNIYVLQVPVSVRVGILCLQVWPLFHPHIILYDVTNMQQNTRTDKNVLQQMHVIYREIKFKILNYSTQCVQ